MDDGAVPERPFPFLESQNTLAGHGATITLTEGDDRIDFEAELGA